MAKECIKSSQFKKFDPNIINGDLFKSLILEDSEELKKLYDKQINQYKQNKIVPATVVAKTNNGVEVTISYKSNGFINNYEFNTIELEELHPGKIIDVLIEELETADGTITLSYQRAKEAKAWDRVAQLFKENKPVEGVVTGKVKGGLYVDIGITVFLPGSQIDTQRVVNFDQWIGQKIQAYILKLMPRRGNIIISRRKYIYEQKSEVRKGFIDTLVEDQIIEGTVKNITKYGAFIDIGGIDGLLHITDMAWRRIDDPSEIITIGDIIKVKILSFDKINEKISLGMKQLTENPWENLPESIVVGSVIKGTVISIKDYGVFIEIVKGVEGLVHISEISWVDRISDTSKYFTIGQEVESVVVSLERKNRRMSLSIKQIEKNPWDVILEQYSVGQKIKGRVTNIADFGFFVQIATGVDALVHISDISWTQHINHPGDIYKKDDIIEAVITDINKQKRKISLSVKGLHENPWNKISEELPVKSFISGVITKIADFGAFVKLQNFDIEAFIHISECSDIPNVNINSVLEVGKEYNFRVLRVIPEEQKIGLSLRKNDIKKQQGNNNKYNNNENSNSSHSHKKPDYKNNSYNRDNNEKRSFNSSSKGSDKKHSSLQLELERVMNENKKDK